MGFIVLPFSLNIKLLLTKYDSPNYPRICISTLMYIRLILHSWMHNKEMLCGYPERRIKLCHYFYETELLIYFIYGLINYNASSSDYITMTEWLMIKELERSGYGLVYKLYQHFWWDWGKPLFNTQEDHSCQCWWVICYC